MKNYLSFRTLAILLFTLVITQESYAKDPHIGIFGLDRQLEVTDSVACYVNKDHSVNVYQIKELPFRLSLDNLQRIMLNGPNHFNYWVRFGIRNIADSSLELHIYVGDLNYIDLYFISDDGTVQHTRGGDLSANYPDGSFAEKMAYTFPVKIGQGQSGEVFVKIQQRTQEFYFERFEIYDTDALYHSFYKDYEHSRTFTFFQILFLGYLLSQILYVLFQGVIIRRREYFYYVLYLVVLVLYFLSKYETLYGITFLFGRYPLLQVYLGKTLLILPYFLYFRFVRNFLDIPANYAKLNTWIVWLENFLVAYAIFDFVFILLTFNQRLQSTIFTYVLILVFLLTASFIIYMFRQKQVLIYFILSGSLFVAIGNILGLVLTYLADNKHIYLGSPNKVIYAQIGVVLETICFTAGLGFKNQMAEKAKIKSQQDLIKQFKANEKLQQRMQNIRNEIARDLHDEIGSTLSSISILSELVLKEHSAEQALDTIGKIKKSSVSMMEKMDDIIWSINPRNDSMEKLLMRVRAFATALFEARNIDYTFSIRDEVKQARLPIEYRQHIYLIVKEAVNNLIKYSGASEAFVEISRKDHILEILVRDNGKGFLPSGNYEGNGMVNMNNRAVMMGADLKIKSQAGKGTSIILKVKIE